MITDNTGSEFFAKEIGPNNYYTNQLGTNVSQIRMEVPPPKQTNDEGGKADYMVISNLIFVKDDGTGIGFIESYINHSSYDLEHDDWVKQQ